MIGRVLATLGILALLGLDLALPATDIGRRGTSAARNDAPGAVAKLGERLPDFTLTDLDGRVIRNADLRGHRVLLTFERSVDWWPFTKARLVELRRALADEQDVVVLYVMASNQVNAKTLRFIDELGLRERIRFARDEGSAAIDALGLRKRDPEPIEAGVPHPATYLLDRDGVVRFVDVREDFQIWIDPAEVTAALARVP